jgi:hypothetical protein
MVLRFRNGTTERCSGSCEIAVDSGNVRLKDGEGTLREVSFADLKAIFFLRSQPLDDADLGDFPAGSVLAVEFADGEIIRGIAAGYRPGAGGFMLHPFDRTSHERIFVVASAVLSIDVEKL